MSQVQRNRQGPDKAKEFGFYPEVNGQPLKDSNGK